MPSDFVAVRAQPLAAQLARHMRMRIADGAWLIGSKIPGENQLAEEYEVSRGTVREALRALTMAGLLEARVGDGTYVRAIDEISAMLVGDTADGSDLKYAMDVREIFEAAAAVGATRYATAEQIAEMRVAIERRRQASVDRDIDRYVEADSHLHRTVVAASGNPILLRLYDAVGQLVVDSIRQSTSLPEDPALGDVHQRLVDAIAAGEAGSAREAAGELSREVRFLDSVSRGADD
jgi:DNA-binding FadR family transcriptional regulator